MTPEDALTRYHTLRAKVNGEQNELTEFSLREKQRRESFWQQKRRQLPKAKVPAGTVCNGCGLELAEGTRASRAKNITHAHGDYVWGYVYYCETCTGAEPTK